MDKEPSEPQDSTPPEAEPEEPDEPVTAVPTNETTPVWAQTKPVAPAAEADDAPGTEETLPPAVAMGKAGDPDWSAPDESTDEGTNGEAKKPPEWAQTVPTSPGEPIDEGQPVEKAQVAGDAVMSEAADTLPPVTTEAPITEPPKAVASDQLKSTWPPRSENTPAPAQETDIWPPEPPTEPAMPAWPPSSDLAGHAQKDDVEEEPATPAQAIPSWPESFDEPGTATTPPAETAATVPPSTPEPEPEPAHAEHPEQPVAAEAMPAIAAEATPAVAAEDDWHPEDPPPLVVEAAPTQPPAPAPAPAPPAPTPAPSPAAATVQPAWAPNAGASETQSAPHRESAPQMQIPSWAPRVPLAAEPGTPTWFSPKEQIPHPTTQPAAQPGPKPEPPPTPPAPIAGGQLPVAPVPPPAPTPAQPQAAKQSWQVVQQAPAAKAAQGPTAEDRSYAEWFAWAKRGGAPASACHAAAQGAFKALSSGKDVNTAVQWATAAMSRPPENVSYGRQTYCAWFALANIDLNMDQHRSHAFAGAAVQALDAGADASQAHAAGLAAAGYR